MADRSTIPWTDATWNIITGCTLVDEGCRHCYAARMAATWPAVANHPSRKGLARLNAAGEAKFTGEVRFNSQWLDQPLRWRKPRKIFVCAHGDLFHEAVPDEWIDQVFAVMALCPQHTFQVLTKRPERAREYLTTPLRSHRVRNECLRLDSERWDRQRGLWPLPNVWLGTSASDQASADKRIPELLACPAAVRFLSAEPLLGPVNLTRMDPLLFDATANALTGKWRWNGGPVTQETPRLDWIIVGGESGPGARPMDAAWAESIRDQCRAAGVAFFMKQMAKKAPIPTDLMVREFPL